MQLMGKLFQLMLSLNAYYIKVKKLLIKWQEGKLKYTHQKDLDYKVLMFHKPLSLFAQD